jgi:D-alanyl-lipoteichoic acid acyltransferase DltB (MBOAT superfamily)
VLFNSVPFLFGYLPLVVAGFFLLGWLGWVNVAAVWLGVASLAFYGYTNPTYLLPIIIVSIAFNFLAGDVLARRPDRRFLFFAVAANLLLLGYFKYADFFIETVAPFAPFNIAVLKVALPIGISFFTFTQIAFLVDAFRGEAREYKLHHYVLFVTFFPHLIAGPILHHKEMMPQFQDRRTYRLNPSLFSLGLSWFAAGLFKKVILADSIGSFVAPVFDSASQSLGFIDAWMGVISYALQIYFDFSGYSDMAIGLSLLFGIRLPLNFNSPYQAVSIADFWRRWHMTLSRFLRDYLYFPLGGNRKGPARRYANLIVTMLLGGLWHGASWNFVAWGGIHGTALAMNHFWSDTMGRHGVRLPSAVSRILTLLIVLWAWVPFRAKTLDHTLTIWNSMVHVSSIDSLRLTALDASCVYWAVALSGIALFLPNTQTILAREPVRGGVVLKHLAWHPKWQWAIATGAAFGTAVGVITIGAASEFLYFRF